MPDEVATPTPRPDGGDVLDSAGLELALKALANGDPAGATVAAYALPNRVDIRIVDWLVATSGDKQVSSLRIADVRKRLADWPGQGLLRLALRAGAGPRKAVGRRRHPRPRRQQADVGRRHHAVSLTPTSTPVARTTPPS